MNPEEPTKVLGLKIWWAYFWRAMLLIIPGSLLIGVVGGIIAALIRLGPEYGGILGGVSGLIVGLYMSAYVFKRLMTKGFGPYRLVVVKK